MRDTDAQLLEPGLVRLTRRGNGVTLWLTVLPSGEARYSYSEEVARRWYAEAAQRCPA